MGVVFYGGSWEDHELFGCTIRNTGDVDKGMKGKKERKQQRYPILNAAVCHIGVVSKL